MSGGILVGRTLVHAYVKDSAEYEKSADLARYTQLLAGKLGFSPIDVYRVVLAAWLSALVDQPELIGSLVAEYRLGEFIGPSANAGETGPMMLSLIRAYLDLRAQQPEAATKTDFTRRQLQASWADTPAKKNILNKFIRILDDEKFLLSHQAAVSKVLLVDPAEAVSPVITIPLQNQGYLVLAVGNVPDAEKVLDQELPDVVLTEMDIPIEDGLELCKKMKAKPETSQIPVLMMTSSKSSRVHRNCVKAGAEDIFIRPLDMELISIKLRRLLESKPAAAQPAGGLAGSLKDIQLSDVVQILCAGMKDVKLTLNSGGQEGAIYINSGEIVDVEAGELRGEPAFYRVMKWKEGTFTSRPCEEFPPRTIELPAMSLLMEAARRLDEDISEQDAGGMEVDR